MSSIQVSGDFGALAKLRAQIEALPSLPNAIAIAAAPEISRLSDLEFSTGTDPYGNPWAPLKNGGGSPLSGAADVSVIPGAAKIKVVANKPLNFHDTGTRQTSRKTAAKALRKAVKQGFLAKMDKATIKAQATAIRASSDVHDPKRQIVPDDGNGIPDAWEKAIAKTAADLFEKAVST